MGDEYPIAQDSDHTELPSTHFALVAALFSTYFVVVDKFSTTWSALNKIF